MSRMDEAENLARGAAAVPSAAWPVTAEGKRLMPVRAALEWAFGTEHARLDFDDLGYRDNVSTLWVMLQRGALGCRVDGGGRSSPADDAEIIAGAVAALPEAQGGRGMAVRVAELARHGQTPGWCRNQYPRCKPASWRQKRDGTWEARTQVVRQYWVYSRRQRVRREDRMCPVTYDITAAEIARARRAYLDWWGTLLHLWAELSCLDLDTIEIAQGMPPMTPWADQAEIERDQRP